MQTTILTPGSRLGTLEEYIPGEGTYVRGEYIFSSVLGTLKTSKPTAQQINEHKFRENKLLITVEQDHKEKILVPQIGNTVIARITKITPQFAKVDILCIGDQALKTTYPGMIRIQDIRKTEIDKLKMIECFRPGDLVRAQLISLGDSRSYFLSTASNELGVIFARSALGGILVPVSWKEMQCLKTGVRELRKVAKVSPK